VHIYRSFQQPDIDAYLLHWCTHCTVSRLGVLTNLCRVHVNFANTPAFRREAFSAWSTVTTLWQVRRFGRPWLFLSPKGDLLGQWQTLLQVLNISWRASTLAWQECLLQM
jgi:hypothetical protein